MKLIQDETFSKLHPQLTMAAKQVPLEVSGDRDVRALAGSAGEKDEPGRQSYHSAAGLVRGGQLYPYNTIFIDNALNGMDAGCSTL